jgi:hypothetical protein
LRGGCEPRIFASAVFLPARRGPDVARARTVKRSFHSALPLAAVAVLLGCAPASAEEKIPMPLGAFECKTIEPVIEHAKIVRQPTTTGLREFVEAKTASGDCRVVETEVTVTVADVDQRGYALVQQHGESSKWWTDAENVWGYFDAPKKVKEWKKP